MGFYLYEVSKEGNKWNFSNPQPIKLAGKNGPIAKYVLYVLSQITETTEKPFKWHMPKEELLLRLGIQKVDKYAVVIDLKPKGKEVEMYELHDIWGYSYNEWTPVALHLKALPIKEERKTNAPPSHFTTTPDQDPIVEFLYLKGGIQKGDWGWGPVGSVNGTLLWPDAFQYFLSVFPKELVEGKKNNK